MQLTEEFVKKVNDKRYKSFPFLPVKHPDSRGRRRVTVDGYRFEVTKTGQLNAYMRRWSWSEQKLSDSQVLDVVSRYPNVARWLEATQRVMAREVREAEWAAERAANTYRESPRGCL
jgi:hypothetical protein